MRGVQKEQNAQGTSDAHLREGKMCFAIYETTDDMDISLRRRKSYDWHMAQDIFYSNSVYIEKHMV